MNAHTVIRSSIKSKNFMVFSKCLFLYQILNHNLSRTLPSLYWEQTVAEITPTVIKRNKALTNIVYCFLLKPLVLGFGDNIFESNIFFILVIKRSAWVRFDLNLTQLLHHLQNCLFSLASICCFFIYSLKKYCTVVESNGPSLRQWATLLTQKFWVYFIFQSCEGNLQHPGEFRE